MKLKTVRIENLRAFRDVTVPFNNYTCLVGPNGSGKSTVLCALNIFFRESENASTNVCQLEREDFHLQDTSQPIRVTVTFSDLSDEAKADFADYVRHNSLSISSVAHFNEETQRAEVKQFGQRLVMDQFKPFFAAVGERVKVADLKTLYAGYCKTISELAKATAKAGMIEALQTYEAAHPDKCKLASSEDQFYGFSKGANRLAKHLQWVYVPAVKDASTEQSEARNSALGRLLERTVRSKTDFSSSVAVMRAEMRETYQALLDENQHALDNISASLGVRLSEWAHPDARVRLEWRQDPEKSVRVEEPWAHIIAGEGDFDGSLSRFGHGLQRSYLLALLQELASVDATRGPRLVLGCEEPELYQHPPQARHLATVLQQLAKSNSQTIVSTHSPLFVSGEGFEDVRMIRKNDSGRESIVTHMSYAEVSKAIAAARGEMPQKPAGVLANIHQALQPHISEMFFTRRLILVEGLEDLAYITAYLNLMDKWDEYRRAGCHIVPTNGKSRLMEPLVVAQHMKIPTYVVFDSDADTLDTNGRRARQRKDNTALLTLLKASAEAPFPEATIRGNDFTMWKSCIGDTVKEDIGNDAWKTYAEKASRTYGNAGGLKKNSLYIGALLTFAWEDDAKSPNLERLCNEILAS